MAAVRLAGTLPIENVVAIASNAAYLRFRLPYLLTDLVTVRCDWLVGCC